MTQDQLIILLLKIFIISGFLSLIGWVTVYSLLARWWHNPIGRTLVIKTLLIAALLVPFGLGLFFNLSRLDSRVTAWVDVFLIGAISPVMWWRTTVWIRESKKTGADIRAQVTARFAWLLPRKRRPMTPSPAPEPEGDG